MNAFFKFFLLFLFSSLIVYAQSNRSLITGLIVNSSNGKSVSNVHIVNANTNEGTISNSIGYFQIQASEIDTLLISHITYQTIKIIVKDYTACATNRIVLSPTHFQLDEIVLRKGNWQQFKLEFVQTEFKAEQSSEVLLKGVQQYKGPHIGFQPSLFTAISNPISFTHHYLNKKARQKRKTKRYQRIIKNTSYIYD